MSLRQMLGVTVFDAALERIIACYEQGHKLVVSLSGGKDSTCCLEMCVLAAQMTDNLPVLAVTRDEEILYPGTYEYLDRVHQRDDVELHHLVAHQPVINAFNREQPYWWVFDPAVPSDKWVRQPPPYAEYISELNIRAMTTEGRFPVDKERGQKLMSVIGLRVQESRGRMYGLFSSGGYLTKPDQHTGVTGCRPIYDWRDDDVWRAIKLNNWDYSEAYNVMHRYGVSKNRMRIGPPSMNTFAIRQLKMASQAWPNWWDRVCARLPGMRSAAQFGQRVVEPERRLGESWEATFWRECVENAPAWIAERAQKVHDQIVPRHSRHSSTPFPDVEPCVPCQGNLGSWKQLAKAMYLGDPFSIRANRMPYVEPETFRAGAGHWNGTPAF